MADQDFEVTDPIQSDHKRKIEDLESLTLKSNLDLNVNSEHEPANNDNDSDAKRIRIDDFPNELNIENVHEAKEEDESVSEDKVEQTATDIAQVDGIKVLSAEAQQTENNQQDIDTHETEEAQNMSDAKPHLDNVDSRLQGDQKEPCQEIPQQGIVSSKQQLSSDTETLTRKIEVPNSKVGVLIGKSGETIRNLQSYSGAKIQITRDGDANQSSITRPVELIGGLESINKAEKLINDVIEEADAGGSPSLVARGFGTAQVAGAAEQTQIQVPNEKVGVIIGKGGETIRSLQIRSGARIQLIPQHLPQGDQSKVRTVRLTGDWKQIEMAKGILNEVMNQPARESHASGGYNQHAGRSRGAHQWARPVQPVGYDHPHRGPHSSHNSHARSTYGNSNYSPQQIPRANHSMHGNYNYEQPYYSRAPAYHGFEPKYENQNPYPQPLQGYPPQQYIKPNSYELPQSYVAAPKTNQPEMLYQGQYAQTMPPQQQAYPYASSGPTQQTYPPYGAPPVANSYNMQQPTSVPAQQVYGCYQSTQPVYVEQPGAPAQSSAGYGVYQVPVDNLVTLSYAAQPSGQQGYVQPVATQMSYNQSAGQPSFQQGGYVQPMASYDQSVGGYAGVVQPTQPGQYDSTQAYGAQR